MTVPDGSLTFVQPGEVHDVFTTVTVREAVDGGVELTFAARIVRHRSEGKRRKDDSRRTVLTLDPEARAALARLILPRHRRSPCRTRVPPAPDPTVPDYS